MTAGRRAPDGQTTLARGCATDTLRPSVHRVSVALLSRLRRTAAAHPSHIRRLSAVQPPSIRHIRPKSASSKRLCIVGVSLQCGQVVVFVAVAVAVVASSSRARCAVVALSSHRRRIVVASSSHRPPCRRRNVVVLSLSGRQDPSSYTRNHTPHVFRT